MWAWPPIPKIFFNNLPSILVMDLSLSYIFTAYKIVTRIIFATAVTMLTIGNIQSQFRKSLFNHIPISFMFLEMVCISSLDSACNVSSSS